MADLTIDVSDDEGEFTVSNELSFDMRLNFPGLTIDLSPEQAQQIYNGLREFFGGED